MNGSDILVALDRLAATSCRSTKLADLAALLEDPLFALITRLTCDSFITFGVKAPSVSSHGHREIYGTNDPVFVLLDALQCRKLAGAMARSALIATYAELTFASGELLRRILSRNLGCGLGAPSLNSVRPAHVPSFAVMLASKFEDNLFSPGKRYVAEPKRDGVRAICLVSHDSAHFLTRNGRPLSALDDLARAVSLLAQESHKRSALPAPFGDGFTPTLVLDGEVVSGDLAQTVSDVRQRTRFSTAAAFEIFDIVPYAAFSSDECIELPFIERRQVLEQLSSNAPPQERISLVEQRPVKNVADCYACQHEWEEKGFEGAVIKDLDAPYRKGRSQAWLKAKRSDTEDLPICDVFEGTGRHAGTLAGVVCDFNGVLVRVGSGFSDDQRRDLWQRRDRLRGRTIEVTFQEVTPNRSLRHPRFIRFREDKDSL